ncbi:GspH/FimT family pseudopilin [Massilia sp. W12]|uniref:GspH/FimT family pseudopilin n=1 Tax=Massilia sp. W12 TaxID=3126507 RepID=UPI0030CEA981
MVTVLITVLLLTVGVPNMAGFLNDSKVSTHANDMIGAMTLARSEAVQRSRLVTICRSEKPNDAAPQCSNGSTNWNAGWIVFAEGSSAPATVGVFDNGDTILYRQDVLPQNVNAQGNLSSLTFNAMGEAAGAVNPAFQFNYSVSGNAKAKRQVCIGRTGRVRVLQGVNDNAACN